MKHIGTLSCSCLSCLGIVHAAVLIYTLYIYVDTCVYMHIPKLLHSTIDAACEQTLAKIILRTITDLYLFGRGSVVLWKGLSPGCLAKMQRANRMLAP